MKYNSESAKIRTVMMPNEQLLPIVVSYVKQGKKAILPLKGYSMRPFLENGRDKALLIQPNNLKVGDAVLAEITPGHYVLHRLWKLDGDDVTLLGDGNLGFEHCKLNDVRAKVEGFYRKGRNTLDRTDGRKWKVYSWLWIRLFPVRRWILAVYRRTLGRKWQTQ